MKKQVIDFEEFKSHLESPTLKYLAEESYNLKEPIPAERLIYWAIYQTRLEIIKESAKKRQKRTRRHLFYLVKIGFLKFIKKDGETVVFNPKFIPKSQKLPEFLLKTKI